MQKNTPEEFDLEIYPDGGANTKQILDNLNLITSDQEDDDYLMVVSGTNELKFNDMGFCLFAYTPNLLAERLAKPVDRRGQNTVSVCLSVC